ncbi:AMP-binding protein [Streptomyces sp. NPDC001795]|uniref:AMP-binding protein n=1 Tax=unclassified Streptomyces TaxID=2593676 RepID=UPI003322C60E
MTIPRPRTRTGIPRPAAPGDILDPASPAVPTAEQCVLGPLLRRRARERPDAPYALMPDGELWSYARTLRESERTAAALQVLGVARGDRVLSWLPNGADALRTWYGTNFAGATLVPLNVAYRGANLTHVLADSAAGVLVCRPELAERLSATGVGTGAVHTVVLLPAPDDTPESIDQVAAGLDRRFRVVIGLNADSACGSGLVGFAEPHPPPAPWDAQTIIYTSGTTGPSKGVVSSYAHLYSSCTAAFHGIAGPDDRYLLQLPLFHAGGTIGAYGMLVHGGSLTVVPAFTTKEFWPLVRRTGTTLCTLLGVMATYLLKEPPDPADRDHPMREVFVVPFGGDTGDFARRFGVQVRALFNMTEVSCPVSSGPDPGIPMYCGTPRPGIEAKVVDEHDREVPDGALGELVLRSQRPWSFLSGYHARPEATAEAWRNGWFHTGDTFRRAPDGGLVFVDRKKDAIRRRGENISSYEVEAQALAHPAVREAAAVAVPGDEGEDEVLLVVCPLQEPGAQPPDPVALLGFLQGRLAHFMLPRYVRVLDALPKTPTGKPLKHVLRAEGVTEDTWDRETAGIRIRREKLL